MFVFFKSEGEEEREAPSPFLPAEVRDLLRRQLQREAAGTALRGPVLVREVGCPTVTAVCRGGREGEGGGGRRGEEAREEGESGGGEGWGGEQEEPQGSPSPTGGRN